MKYLTPQLYVKINEANDDEVESLYQQWNAAGANARAHLQQVKQNLPPKMQQFCETLCLHDAEVLGINVSGGDNGAGTPVATISVRQDNDLICPADSGDPWPQASIRTLWFSPAGGRA